MFAIQSQSRVHTARATTTTPIGELRLFPDGTVYLSPSHPWIKRLKPDLTLEWNLSWRGEWDANMEEIRLTEGWERIGRIWDRQDQESQPARDALTAQWQALIPQIQQGITTILPTLQAAEAQRLQELAQIKAEQECRDAAQREHFRGAVTVGTKLKSFGDHYTVVAINGEEYTLDRYNWRGTLLESGRTVGLQWIWSYQIQP